MNKLLAEIRLQQIERAREDARCRVHALRVSGQLAEADGQYDVECNPLQDAAGNIYEWCGTNTDIEASTDGSRFAAYRCGMRKVRSPPSISCSRISRSS